MLHDSVAVAAVARILRARISRDLLHRLLTATMPLTARKLLGLLAPRAILGKEPVTT